MKSRNLLLIAMSGVLAGWLPSAQAQKSVILQNVDPETGASAQGTNTQIPLTGTAQVNASGNIVVDCELADGKCPNIGGSVAVSDAPTINFNSPTVTITTASAAESALTWSTNGADACYGKKVERITGTGPAAPSDEWNTAQPSSATYNLTSLFNEVEPGSSSTYQFTLRCYSNEPSVVSTAQPFGVGAIEDMATVTLSPPENQTPPAGNCETYLESLGTEERDHFDAYNADNRGFSRLPATFQARTGRVLGEYSGVLGKILPGKLGENQYLALSFSLSGVGANTGKFSLTTDVGNSHAHPVIITISPCPGDFRPRNSSSDKYTGGICRSVYDSHGRMVRGAIPGAPGATGEWCDIPAGQTMYMNIAKRDLYKAPGSPIPAASCAPTVECGAGAQLSK